MKRNHPHAWTKKEVQILKKLYATTRNSELSGILGRSKDSIYQKARDLRLKKDRKLKGMRGVNVLEVIKERQRRAGYLEE